MKSSAERDSWSASVDIAAAERWARLAQARASAPWLHEEIGQRLLERIDWVQLPAVTAWCNWHWPQGGAQLHHSLAARWLAAACYTPTAAVAASIALTPAESAIDTRAAQAASTPKFGKNILRNVPLTASALKPWQLGKHWLQRRFGRANTNNTAAATTAAPLPYSPPPQSVQVLVANMLLHSSANPGQLLQSWQQSLSTGGVLFFSCLGPDTLQAIQQLYARLGWPAPMQRLVDMHDLGDALVNTGFATPVMEMERLTLTYASTAALLAELRELGRNLHPKRFAGLRGRAWRQRLEAELNAMRSADGRIHLPIEVIYGHAFKPAPPSATSESVIRLDQLRRNLPGQAPL